jgi:hypothetical protein
MAGLSGLANNQIDVKFPWDAAADSGRREGARRDIGTQAARQRSCVDAIVPNPESPLSVSPYLLLPAKPRPKFFPGDCIRIDGAPVIVRKVTWERTGWSYYMIDGQAEPAS